MRRDSSLRRATTLADGPKNIPNSAGLRALWYFRRSPPGPFPWMMAFAPSRLTTTLTHSASVPVVAVAAAVMALVIAVVRVSTSSRMASFSATRRLENWATRWLKARLQQEEDEDDDDGGDDELEQN